MSSVAELCRITVHGPNGKVDLAVPVLTPVAELLPVFARHTVEPPSPTDPAASDGSWVLQRLGAQPFDPDGTPETLDWLQGEQFYLRAADDPLPELDFDDVADGISTAINRQPDRWRPEFSRWLFLGTTALVLLLVGAVLLDDGPTGAQAGTALSISVALLAATTLAARMAADVALVVLTGLAGCGFAALSGLIGGDGVTDRAEFTMAGLLMSSVCAFGAAAVLLGARQAMAKPMPWQPFLAVGLFAILPIAGIALHAGFGFSQSEAAGLLATFLFALVIFAPKLAIRFARLRGPQLPRTAEELQQDSSPASAAEVLPRSVHADHYLSVAMICVGLGMTVAYTYLMNEPGWIGWTLVLVFSSAVLLRSRAMFSAWQRMGLVVSGVAGWVLVTLWLSEQLTPIWRAVLLVGLACVLAAQVLAAVRQPTRRMLPVWGHLANIFDAITALAVVPLLLQLLGVYAWARGLFG